MKKTIVSLLLVLTAFIGLGVFSGQVNAGQVEHDGKGEFNFKYHINYGNSQNSEQEIPGVAYGQRVSIDAGSMTHNGHEFLGFLVEGKLNPSFDPELSIRVRENMNVEAFFKPENTTAVVFMDANQDVIEVQYTNEDGKISPWPDYSMYTKTGLEAKNWVVGENVVDENTVFTSDTVVCVSYENAISEELVLLVENGTGEGFYDFNETVTVTANGEGTFEYWLKDDMVASFDETYTFTMASDHELVAVYDTGFVADSDLLISAQPYWINEGMVSFVGQFDIPEGYELVEYGILFSEYPGAITLNTPDVVVLNSNKFNPNTHEFVLSMEDPNDEFNFRAFMVTADSEDNIQTTYSYAYQEGYAEELFISEVIEGSSNNKAIELFNGTGDVIDLSDYTVELYSSGSTSSGPKYTEELSGTLENYDVFIIYNSQANATIKAVGDISSSVTYFNGDDVIVLKKGEEIIDIVGELNNSTKFNENKTIIRNSDVIGPYVGLNGSNQSWDSDQWTEYSIDSFDNLGFHEVDLPLLPLDSTQVPGSIMIIGSNEVRVNEFITLSETYPEGGLEGVYWVSSDTDIADIDLISGEVLAYDEGEVTFTAYSFYDNDVYASVEVTVLPPQTYTITFDSNEGSAVESQVLLGGEKVLEPTAPTKENNLFDGWYTD